MQTCSSETSVDIQRTTRRYIPQNRTLQIVICFKLQFLKEKWKMFACIVYTLAIYDTKRRLLLNNQPSTRSEMKPRRCHTHNTLADDGYRAPHAAMIYLYGTMVD
jgi:hypothetical protein